MPIEMSPLTQSNLCCVFLIEKDGYVGCLQSRRSQYSTAFMLLLNFKSDCVGGAMSIEVTWRVVGAAAWRVGGGKKSFVCGIQAFGRH
jgi:hypothetical protein